MGWKFRKRVKIAPGVHVNVSKSGISTSIGPKGASVTVGPNGSYVNTSIPGTGLSYRKKISSSSSNKNNVNSNHDMLSSNNNVHSNVNTGCRVGCIVLLLPLLVGGILTISSTPASEIAKGNYAEYWLLAVVIVALWIIIVPLFKRSNKRVAVKSLLDETPCDESSELVENYGYDYVIERYLEDEKNAIAKSESEIEDARIQLKITSDPNKKLFLQSVVDCTKYDRLSRLINVYRLKNEETTENLDPLFNQAAQKVVLSQRCDVKDFLVWFGKDLSPERRILLKKQLCECGIIYDKFESSVCVLVKNTRTLKAIIKKAQGKTLLPNVDKIRVIEYLDARENEVIGNHATRKHLEDLPSNIKESYNNFIQTFNALYSSNAVWVVLSVQNNTEAKSSASTLIERNSVYLQSGKNYGFVGFEDDTRAAYFNFMNVGVELYIYPRFVVVVREDNFDVVPFSQFDIEYSRSNFIEESTDSLPKDAKLVRFTYKYVNRNGERDARYSNNPRYGVYEYGNITFKPLDLTLQFSNAEVAANFARAFQMLKKGTFIQEDSVFGVPEEFFNNAKEVSNAINTFYDTLINNRSILQFVEKALPKELGSAQKKLRALFLSDIVKCYESLGHDSSNLLTKEGLAMVLVVGHTVSNYEITFDTIQLPTFSGVVNSISDVSNSVKNVFIKKTDDDYFLIKEVLKSTNQEELVTRYFSLLYRLFSVIAKADGVITAKESAWLENLMAFSHKEKNNILNKFENAVNINEDAVNSQNPSDFKAKTESNTNPLKQLQDLIGLDEVKKEITALANFVRIQKEREKKGLKAVGLSYHCVFTGNPGTGKTTVARIVAEIYRSLGLLKKGHLVETDRSGLVAEYVGQTAAKTNKIIDSALDGVLFIDEAYSLVQGGNNDYGHEAISTLLKRMEDDRNRLVVILAGYGDDMKRFIDSNPGLQSRFNRYIHFADYNVQDLKDIFLLNAKNCQYILSEEAERILIDTLTFAVEHKDKNFGNGRFVRNLFERTLQNQAVRLSVKPQTTAEDLSTLTHNDIPTNN